MDANWYTGHHKVDALFLSDCNFQIIHSDAFTSPALTDIYQLFICYNQPILHFDKQAFRQLSNLQALHVHFTAISVLEPNMFYAMRKTLTTFTYLEHGDTLSLSDIFAEIRMSRLYLVSIQTCSDQAPCKISKSLSCGTFAGLAIIRLLKLINCGIEFIGSGTFDFIGETLVALDLYKNRIKTVPVDLFFVFIDNHHPEKTLTVINDNTTCDCHFYEASNMTLIGIDPDLMIKNCWSDFFNCNWPVIDLKCNDLEKIHRATLELTANINVYAYPKVNFYVENDFLMVKSNFIERFRLVMLSGVWLGRKLSTKCADKHWIQESARCFLLNDAESVFQLRELLQPAQYSTVFAILKTTRKRVWPLHIRSFRYSIENQFIVWINILVWSGSIMIGVFIGVAAVLLNQ